jgi:hypothetical protein
MLSRLKGRLRVGPPATNDSDLVGTAALGDVRRLVSYSLATSLRCQASRVAGVTGKIPVPSLARDELRQRVEPGPVGWLVPHPAS